MDLQLVDVQETALIPLAIRANETKRKNARIQQVMAILNNITGSFGRGFLLAELMHPKMMKEKMHDTVKHTNAKFGWGTRTGKELSELNPKLELIKESSFWDEMKKYTLAGKIGSVLAKDLNNRLAVYKWQGGE